MSSVYYGELSVVTDVYHPLQARESLFLGVSRVFSRHVALPHLGGMGRSNPDPAPSLLLLLLLIWRVYGVPTTSITSSDRHQLSILASTANTDSM